MSRKLHLFDLDRTLLRVNSSFAFGKYLYQKGYISFFQMIKVVMVYACHNYCGLSVQKTHEIIFSQVFDKASCATIDQFVSDFIAIHLKSLFYTPAMNILKKSLDSGDYIAILSSGPQFLVEPIAKELNANYGAGTEYVRDGQGCFINVGKVLEGHGKVQHGLELRNQLGIASENVVAYSDSWLDLPMLEFAGTAVAVNPDKNLRALSLAKRWRVI